MSTVEVYDPRNGLWMTGESMNECRGYSSAVVIGEAIYMIGGLKDGNQISDTVFMLAIVSSTIFCQSCSSVLVFSYSLFSSFSFNGYVGGMLQGGYWLAVNWSESSWETVFLLSRCLLKVGTYLPS